jgi:hypothetical protein
MPLSLAVAQGRIEIVLADGLRVIVGKAYRLQCPSHMVGGCRDRRVLTNRLPPR